MPYQTKAELPAAVKKLPDGAQSIFMAAFNAAHKQYKGDEQKAFAVAWAAVKQKYRQEGDKWVAKDHADMSICIVEPIQLEDADLRTTGKGFLVARPRVARAGNIQVYSGAEVGRPELDQVRVYRPPEEVFAPEAMQSLAHVPITNDHPRELVSSSNWKRHAVGWSGDEVARDGDAVRVPMMVADSTAVADVRSGKNKLSVGYTATLVWAPSGTQTEDGQTYDAKQVGIRANHIAICRQARGGPQLCLGDSFAALAEDSSPTPGPTQRRRPRMDDARVTTVDGISCEMSDTAAQVVQRALATAATAQQNLQTQLDASTQGRQAAEGRVTELTTQVGTLTGEVAALKKQLEDAKPTPTMLDGLVRARMDIVGRALSVLGNTFTCDGKTDIEIMRAVCAAKLGDGPAKAMSDPELAGAFKVLTTIQSDSGSGGSSLSSLAASFSTPHNSMDARAKALADRNQKLQDAWRNPPAQGAAS
jgi:uncharacterized protein